MKRPNKWDIEQLARLREGKQARFYVDTDSEICVLKHWLRQEGRTIKPTQGGEPTIIIGVVG